MVHDVSTSNGSDLCATYVDVDSITLESALRVLWSIFQLQSRIVNKSAILLATSVLLAA